jgi:hypothetical protein
MTLLRSLSILLWVAPPLAAQRIDIDLPVPQVAGTRVQAQSCATFDSLWSGKRNLKAKLFRADVAPDTILLTSEPMLTKGEQLTRPFMWVSAVVPSVPLGALPPRVQAVIWTWGDPIISYKTPPGARFLVTLEKGLSVDLGELNRDPMRREVRFSDATGYPSTGQIVYSWTTGEKLLLFAQHKNAKAPLEGGWIGLSNELRGGIIQVLMAATCGVE